KILCDSECKITPIQGKYQIFNLTIATPMQFKSITQTIILNCISNTYLINDKNHYYAMMLF
ncbi:MAG TPA: hypothetical protein PLI34_10935, partial [Saprospiraceae bacterium]|nr:hypothetical protein [Saprospiraceae bacterium]